MLDHCKSQTHYAALAIVVMGMLLLSAGCSRAPAAAAPPAPPRVDVATPLEHEVTEYADYTGQTSAVESVDVRARVWGYLVKVNFKEGALVQKGQLLYEIDPTTYKEAVDAAQAQVQVNEAAYSLAKSNNLRYRTVAKENPASVSPNELDRYQSEEDQARANVLLAKANADQAKTNLEWTRIYSPITGRVSRTLVTEGNVVQSGQTGGTLLTTIVSVDPIYVYFDVDEITVLRVRAMIVEGKMQSARQAGVVLPVYLQLANEPGYPHHGVVDFVDNQINPRTGTLRVRGVFQNPLEVLSPGLFARIRVPIGKPHPALLITERAIDSDQGQKIVYIVDRDNVVRVRQVTLGPRYGSLRAIDRGLSADDRVIVTGLLQIRAGGSVTPNPIQMPTEPSDLQLGGADETMAPTTQPLPAAGPLSPTPATAPATSPGL